jgi:hypothetical protein
MVIPERENPFVPETTGRAALEKQTGRGRVVNSVGDPRPEWPFAVEEQRVALRPPGLSYCRIRVSTDEAVPPFEDRALMEEIAHGVA